MEKSTRKKNLKKKSVTFESDFAHKVTVGRTGITDVILRICIPVVGLIIELEKKSPTPVEF